MPFSDAILQPAGASLADIAGELDRRLGQEDVNILSPYPPVLAVTGVANTFGGWVELVADVGATPIVIIAVIVAINIELAQTAADVEVEIGTGAAAAETRAFGITWEEPITATAVGKLGEGKVFTVNRRIAASARLSCRARDSLAALDGYNVSILYRIGA